MKNPLQNLVVAILVVIANINAKAQYVTIPDPAFANYLNTYYPTCMDGNMLDTTCQSVSEVNYMSLWDGSYTDITGIKYFKNLTSLYIRNHQLVSLPELPASLISLECTNGPLISLPELPSTLIFLEVSQNPLSSLPALPDSLNTLSCENTLLTSLPELPHSLIYLYAGFTKLSSLPALPPSLEVLYCSNAKLTSLPELPSSLGVIYCPNNQIENLPTLPESLFGLYCNFNKITNLPEIPSNLFEIELGFNQLTSLPPIIPESVFYLTVSFNPDLSCVPDIKNETMIFYWGGTNIQCIPYGLIRADNYSIPELNDLPSCIDSNPNECSFTQLDNCPVVKNYNSILETNGYTLSWTPPSGSTKCEISAGIIGKRKFSKIINGVMPSSIFASENFLRANTSYEWKVRCNCETKTEFDDFYSAGYFTTGTDLDFGFPKSNNQEQNIFAEESNLVTNSKNNTKVFPNPAKGNFVIQSDLKNYNLQVTDIAGKLVYSQNNVTETSLHLDIKNIEAGTYFVNIAKENAKEVIKLMVY